MICKKCGANIADNSKFCGYCGNSIEEISIPKTQPETNEIDLGKTIKVEPIQNETVVTSTNPVESINEQINVEPVEQTVAAENNSTEQNDVKIVGKKSNALNFLICVIALLLIAGGIGLFVFAKSSNNSILVLNKAIENLVEKGQNSITINAKISTTTKAGETFDFSAIIKTEKKSEDTTNVEIKVNKSLLFEEMNIYAIKNNDLLTMYMQSNLIDMLGFTYSSEPLWVRYNANLEEMVENQVNTTTTEKIKGMKLSDLVDEKHFVYVNEKEGLKHYEFIIDNELIESIKSKFDESEDIQIKEMIDSLEPIEESIVIDFYLTKSNELSKVEFDMSESLTEEDELSSFVVSIELINLNSTTIEIPQNAINSVTSLEEYMSLYPNLSGDFNIGYIE